MGRRLYPREIIPRKNYVLRMDIEHLHLLINGLLFARRIEGDINLFITPFDNHYRFRLAALEPSRLLPGFSMNLLGGKYVPDRHQAYNPRGKGAKEWQGERIKMWRFRLSQDYSYSEECTSVFVQAASLCSIPVPYKKTLTKEEHESYVKRGIDVDSYTSKTKYSLCGEMCAIHHPTQLNYWHVQADVIPAGEEMPMKGGTTGWKEDVSNYLIQYYLSTPVFVNRENRVVIPDAYYVRTG